MKRAFAVATILLVGTEVQAAAFSGTVDRVVDGDTFWVCDTAACHKIRLYELGYRESAEALEALIQGKSVRCVHVGGGTPCDGRSKPMTRDRIVAQCFVEGTDIAGALIEQGFACDWRRFSGGHYSRYSRGKVCAK
jgi:endonuclease YncB( thermonuclease family)